MTLHVSDAEVRRLLGLEPLIAAVREALIDLSARRVVQPLRSVMEIPPDQGVLFLKPGARGGMLATKLITQIPANAARGLPTMQATIVLMDATTGRTLAVMDATWLTALRTAAASAVAGRLPDPALAQGRRAARQRRARPHPRRGAAGGAAGVRNPGLEP
jgi:ornithine cyclodeaminase/alanine dehydrogenase-like protein (mu-crystallin family)